MEPTQQDYTSEGIERVPLSQFTEKAYLDYPMYVILDRALGRCAGRDTAGQHRGRRRHRTQSQRECFAAFHDVVAPDRDLDLFLLARRTGKRNSASWIRA